MSFKSPESSLFTIMRNLHCISCNKLFLIKDVTIRGSRCPLLLPCGHSICEYCLQQSLKAMKTVRCLQCSSISSVEFEEPTVNCFPVDLYALGSLALQHFKPEKEKTLAFLTTKDGNFNYAFKEQLSTNLKTDLSENVCEECSLEALWYCENCKINFCEICWSRVHGSAKILMRHCKSAICEVEVVSRSGLKKCPEHETQDLEFFCKGCSTTVCSYCVILQHQGEGHFPITLKEKNLEMSSKVRTAVKEAENLRKRMKQTLEKIKVIQSSNCNIPFAESENQITRKFCQIHGILQLEEERLLKKLREKSKEHENSIKELRVQLEKQMENVDSLLRESEVALTKPQERDLTDLHRELEQIQNLPCYLVSPKSASNEVKVIFNENLIESFRLYCAVEFPSDSVFELRSGSDLPENYAVEPLNICDLAENLKFLPKEGKELNVSDVGSSSSNSSQDLTKEVRFLSPKPPREPPNFLERKTYSVRVTYIKNPGEFYVTLNSQRSKQQAIDKRASQIANTSSAVIKAVAKDEIYLVKYQVDKNWYRARIIEVLPARKTGEEESVLIYYIDYGNSETVPVSRLQPIPLDMLEEPPLAVKCRLFDCVPKEGSWCRKSTKTMEKILKGYTATMFVMKSHGDCLEVDLSVIYPEGQIGRDIVSVRDALLFLEFSSFVQGPKSPRNATALMYLNQCLPSLRETFDVIITHVNSPSDFYLQKTRQDASYLYKLTIDLQNYYGENLEKGIIYNPAVGMPCAALFSVDQMWYRAKIVEVPGKKMVTVFYVDYGNKETIPWTAIRKLKECFVKRPPLALNCTMAGILPIDVLWSNKAKSYLENCVMMRDCRVHVHGISKSRKKLKVLVYRQVNRKEVCVNALFVKMGYAVQSGPDSLWKSEPQEKAEQKSEKEEGEKPEIFPSENDEEKSVCGIDEDQETSSAENVALDKNGPLKERKKMKLSARELRERHEFEKKRCGKETSSNEDNENEVDECNKIFKVKVQILSAESPSCIYVTFPALMDEFESLQTKLEEFYRNSSPVDKEWTVDSICAVYDSGKNGWYRGSVLCTLPHGQIKVFLKDIAQICTEPASALRELDSSFTKYATCAVKCHLADIRPPGKQWPSISSEYLLNELEYYKEVYMTKRGQIENRSLPVELWVQKVISRGALEPITKEWITLNQLLVNQGLAVPVSENFLIDGNSTEGEGNSNAEKESENDRPTNVTDFSDGKGLEAESELSNAFLPSLDSKWEPPEPLKRSRFIGIPTYIDSNAIIYIHDIEEDGAKLKMVRESLLQEYENSEPNPEDHFWTAGQLCIVRYHADNFWYRGTVLQINEDLTYDVLFVDYGNVETCPAQDLRKRIKAHEIPILVHKFQLQDVIPMSEDGNWPVPVIDTLHSFIVDKKCEVNVLDMPLDPSRKHLISLRVIESDIGVAQFFVDQGLASFKRLRSFCNVDSDGSSYNQSPSLVSCDPKRESNGESDMPRYIQLRIPDSCSGFFIEVTTAKNEKEFFANIVSYDSLPIELKKVLEEFEILQERLAEECPSQPLIEKPRKGWPCCCVNPRNNKWSRGEIVSVLEENSFSVFYVDYGNREFLSKDLLHECKIEWINLPKMAVEFRLANVKMCPDVSKSVYMKTLTSCLKGSVLFAKILNQQEVLEVILSISENGPLAYQEMVDKKLMTLL